MTSTIESVNVRPTKPTSRPTAVKCSIRISPNFLVSGPITVNCVTAPTRPIYMNRKPISVGPVPEPGSTIERKSTTALSRP